MTVDLIDIARLALVGVIAGLFASYRANREFRSQRWWELQADAYTRLIEALADLLSYYGTLIDSAMTRSDLSDERSAELEAQWSAAKRHLVRATKGGAFLFSDRVADSLRTLEKAQDEYHQDWFQHLDENWGAVRDCLNTVVDASKHDLQLVSRWPARRQGRA